MELVSLNDFGCNETMLGLHPVRTARHVIGAVLRVGAKRTRCLSERRHSINPGLCAAIGDSAVFLMVLSGRRDSNPAYIVSGCVRWSQVVSFDHRLSRSLQVVAACFSGMLSRCYHGPNDASLGGNLFRWPLQMSPNTNFAFERCH
jgi:hypothetical protein